MRVRLKLERLQQLLARSALSQNHWAIRIGLSSGHWSDIVNGRHPYPSSKTRRRMLEEFRVPHEELFEIETTATSPTDVDFRRAISDRYIIDAELGQGGMGSVYLARDVRHGRVVALKVISPEAVSGIGLKQFLREIATVAQLHHPNILPLHDSGEAAGHPFYVMPWVRGGSLRARLERDVRLDVATTLRLTRGIAAALQHAHSERILHCDVKPENVLVHDDHPWVMDFGIARKLHSEIGEWRQRKELDMSAGTPAYVSPEQASGDPDLDARSDVYSLGCMVYEMLTGRTPFGGTNTQEIVSKRFIVPPPPAHDYAPDVPIGLTRVLERALALPREHRPENAAAFAGELEEGAVNSSRVLVAASLTSRAIGHARRRLNRTRIGGTVLNIWQDLRYAARSVAQQRAFASAAVLTLALGIGANTAIFSAVRGVLLKPLPHRDGERLVYLRQSADGPGQANLTFSVPEVRDLREGAPSFAGIAEYSSWGVVHQTKDGPEEIPAGLVTGNFFDVMGLSPVIGRLTLPGDDGPGAAPVAVLTHEYWIKRFGGDSSIVGKAITLDKKPVSVIGVLQPAPFFPQRVDVLLNMVNSSHHLGAGMQNDRSHRMTEVVARLKSGATVDQARAEVSAVYTRVLDQFKEHYDPGAHYRVAIIPFKKALGERASLTLWLLMASAAFVLIVSAANVANLTLIRGIRREHELVVRAALGAGLARLRRLLLAENLLLAVAGAALGVVIAVAGVRLLTSLAARYSSRANEIQLDGVVLGFALALSVLLALLLSFLASLPREGTLASTITAGAHRMSGSLRKQRLQRGLVVVQIAVSVVLLAGAGLLTRTMLRLADVDTGLNTEEVLTMEVGLLTYDERRSNPAAVAEARENYNRMRDEIAALPGVVGVGIGSVPLRPTDVVFDVTAEGRPLAVGEATPRAELRGANPDYFRAAGIPVLRGREFTTTDRTDAVTVVIINQALANRLFAGDDPIGKRIAWTDGIRPVYGDWRTIVGVVGNTQDGGLDAEPRGAVFVQSSLFAGSLVIRASRNAAALAAPATRIVRRIAPTALVQNVLTVPQIKDQSVAPRRLNAALISSFGILAVIIAAIGIAGVLAFAVSARTGEIGIRMSLGADRARVQRMILGEGGVLLAIGLALGVVGAYFSARVIRGLLFGVAPTDPVTFIAVAAMMAAIGI
ncbi:MAG TPA: ADOP family duplicated permease, partial [Gemmatimonadaceae bacterium]|nr:ADOP family duplicated permease [Gemmatimonadaceae bacterium]